MTSSFLKNETDGGTGDKFYDDVTFSNNLNNKNDSNKEQLIGEGGTG